MDIMIPEDLKLINSVEFCKYLDSLPDEPKYTFDFSKMNFVEPFGMLLVSAKIRQFMEKHPDSEFFDYDFEKHTYAANMGFFRSVKQPYGKKPGEAKGNANYLPICKLIIKDIYKDSFDKSEHVVNTIERESNRLAEVISNSNNRLGEILTFSLREIIRNVFEHSNSKHVWYCGQYWPSKDRVEIAILDEGIGIRQSLRKNSKLKINSDEDALYLALEPGISSNIDSSIPDDPYANSGFGLYITSRIALTGGDFIIISGTKTLAANARKCVCVDSSFKGTAIRIRLRVSGINTLSNLTAKIIKEGEAIAKKNRRKSILSASKISSLLTSTYE